MVISNVYTNDPKILL